jgi:hypothetical protein
MIDFQLYRYGMLIFDGAQQASAGLLLTIAPTILGLRLRLSRPVPPWVLYAESVGDFLDCEVALL